VKGPIPDEYGNAGFVVQIGDRRVEAFATVCGAGVYEQDVDVSGPVMRAIFEFIKHRPAETLACLREAAKLRRAAGHAGSLNVEVPRDIAVEPDPSVRGNSVIFSVRAGTRRFRVLVGRTGAIVDDYDDLYHLDGEIESSSLAGGRRAVLDLVLAHPERAAAWGLDCELLDLLWK
jgi:hypothetical protein